MPNQFHVNQFHTIPRHQLEFMPGQLGTEGNPLSFPCEPRVQRLSPWLTRCYTGRQRWGGVLQSLGHPRVTGDKMRILLQRSPSTCARPAFPIIYGKAKPSSSVKCWSCGKPGARKSAFVVFWQCFGFTVPPDPQALGCFLRQAIDLSGVTGSSFSPSCGFQTLCFHVTFDVGFTLCSPKNKRAGRKGIMR